MDAIHFPERRERLLLAKKLLVLHRSSLKSSVIGLFTEFIGRRKCEEDGF
jgi:hypothetical protein